MVAFYEHSTSYHRALVELAFAVSRCLPQRLKARRGEDLEINAQCRILILIVLNVTAINSILQIIHINYIRAIFKRP